MAQRKFPDWATLDIADIGNGDPNKQDPGATKQQEGWKVEKPFLQSMNWIQNLFGHFSRANNEYKLTAIDGKEAEAGEIYVVDNSIATKTFFLPGAPIDGQWAKVTKTSPYATWAVTINGNGNDVAEVGQTTVEMDLDNREFLFFYRAADSLWTMLLTGLINSVGGTSGSAAGYFPTDTPVGLPIPWFGSPASIPPNYILLDGALHNITTFPVLFNILGTTFGGDGIITFGTPDARGRAIAGLDNMGGSAAGRIINAQGSILGGVMGTETHTLTQPEVPNTGEIITSKSPWYPFSNAGTPSPSPGYPITGTAAAGGGQAHNNMQPVIFSNWIIKAA